MKTATKYLLAAVTVVTSVLQSPSVQAAVLGFVHSHPTISTLLAGLGAIGAIIHDPKVSQ